MSDSPLPLLERVDLTRVLTALACLEDLGEDTLLGDATTEASAFFAGLAHHRRSGAYKGRVREPEAVSSVALVDLLIRAATVFFGAVAGGGLDRITLDRLADECFNLAGSIGTAMGALHPADSGILVQIDLDGRGLGELVLVPLTPEEREQAAQRQRAERAAQRRAGRR